MGGSPSRLQEQDVKVFKTRTFFDDSELISYYDKFEELGGSLYEPVRLLPLETIVAMPALASNPLRNRVAEVFCSARDSEQDPVEWSFDDFLQFFNAFSFRSSLLSSWIQSDLADLKIYWAFRIFDFDNDNKISQDDMEIAVALMAGDRRVTREQIASIAAAVIREGDQDDSNSISRTEFKRVLQRVPDFQWHFSIPE